MKFFVIVAIVLAASSSVMSQNMPLSQAWTELRQSLGLHNWAAAWDVRRNADWEVCGLSNEMSGVYPAAFERILYDPLYVSMMDTMIGAGVPWRDFVDNELKLALGYHAVVPSCTTLELGRVPALHGQLYGYFNRPLVDATVARLTVDSAEFAELQADLAASQPLTHVIRCSPEVRAAEAALNGHGSDFNFVFEMLGVIFGWDASLPC